MDRVLMFSRAVQEVISRLLGWLSSLLLLGLTLFALLEIVRRYIFGVVFEWGQDAVIVGIVTAVALSFCVTQVRRGHLVMNAIVLLLHGRGFYKTVGFLKVVTSAVIALFCGAIGVTGWPTLEYALARELTTYSLLIPLWPVYLLLIIGFLLTALVAFLQFVEDVTALVHGTGLDANMEAATDV